MKMTIQSKALSKYLVSRIKIIDGVWIPDSKMVDRAVAENWKRDLLTMLCLIDYDKAVEMAGGDFQFVNQIRLDHLGAFICDMEALGRMSSDTLSLPNPEFRESHSYNGNAQINE